MLLGIHVFYAYLVASLVAVLCWCMEEGMVFGAYGAWLKKKSFEWRHSWITKPMGLCSFCFSAWVALPFGAFIVGLYPLQIILFISQVMLFDRIRTRFLE